jgi:hypothetical protein
MPSPRGQSTEEPIGIPALTSTNAHVGGSHRPQKGHAGRGFQASNALVPLPLGVLDSGHMAIWRRKVVNNAAGDPSVTSPPCPCCGDPLDVSDPRFNLPLPQPVAQMSDEEYEQHVRFASEQIVVTGNIGGFVRALLPIGLDDGRTTTIGVWVSVEADVFAHVMHVGRGELPPDQMQFEGRLANVLDPWGDRMLRAHVSAGVEVPSNGRRRTPHVISSSDGLLTRILTERWPAADVLTGSMAWALAYDPQAPRTPHSH